MSEKDVTITRNGVSVVLTEAEYILVGDCIVDVIHQARGLKLADKLNPIFEKMKGVMV